MIFENQASSDFDTNSQHRSLVVAKNTGEVGYRLKSIVLIAAYAIATAGWLWLLIDLALWLMDF